MAAMEPLCLLIGVDPQDLSKEELALLEADLHVRVCNELKEIHRQQYQNYFYLMKLTKIQEDEMLEQNFLRNIINDLLATKAYDFRGIATYADTHEDVIREIAYGLNTQPSEFCFRRVVELDRTNRNGLYQGVATKIIAGLINDFIKKWMGSSDFFTSSSPIHHVLANAMISYMIPAPTNKR